jgi:hypothetical protein
MPNTHEFGRRDESMHGIRYRPYYWLIVKLQDGSPLRFKAATSRIEAPYLFDSKSKGIRLWPTNFGLVFGRWEYEIPDEGTADQWALKILDPNDMDKEWDEEEEGRRRELARKAVSRFIARNNLDPDEEWRAYQALGLDQ